MDSKIEDKLSDLLRDKDDKSFSCVLFSVFYNHRNQIQTENIISISGAQANLRKLRKIPIETQHRPDYENAKGVIICTTV